MGKKKVKSKEELKNLMLPVANDVTGIVTKMHGYDRFMVKCQDSHECLCRIREKMKRRMWTRLGDIVLVSHGISNQTSKATSYGVTKEIKPNG